MYRDRGKFTPHAGCPTPKTCKMNGACMAPSKCHGAKKNKRLGGRSKSDFKRLIEKTGGRY